MYKTIIKFCKNFWRTNLKSLDKKGRIIMSGDTMTMKRTKFNIRTIAVTGMLGALATVLMFLEFPIPMLIPPFIKFDFSELPALLAAYAMGPVSGIAVCFIKSLCQSSAYFQTTLLYIQYTQTSCQCRRFLVHIRRSTRT